jgi:6-pyruvoyltetrahydropterin/6-carboxytetrahydropterin synthase
MGRKKFSELSPEVASAYRADMSDKKRQAWARGAYANRQNGALQEETQQKIRDAVRARWEEGAYANRINGMFGTIAALNPNWTWGKRDYRAILSQFEEPSCYICGIMESESKLDAHHFDEIHENYLLSNLGWFCVPCHLWRFHYQTSRHTASVKQPFVTISKRFPFEYAHILPWHHGKCGQLHGHSGHLTVSVRARLDPNGVTEDYYDIGKIAKMVIVDRLDHKFLNDFIPNPTSEEFLIFAWQELEFAGLKGLSTVEFSETESTTASLTKADMIEAFGWDRAADGTWVLVQKPSETLKS